MEPPRAGVSRMRFVKMHGLGNDFVLVDQPIEVEPEVVARLCHRRLGVGADGLLAVGSDGGMVDMRYWNADGSPAEMCGNGLRCVARYALDRGLVGERSFIVTTPSGPRRVEVGEHEIKVELGPAEPGELVTVGGRTYRLVTVGNPHAVTLVDDLDEVDVEGIGESLQHTGHFPHGVNVEFVRPAGPGRIALRVWERGVGETLACGSGMAAAATATHGLWEAPEHPGSVEVAVPGGVGTVDLVDGTAWLTGPAVYVYAGEWPVNGPS